MFADLLYNLTFKTSSKNTIMGKKICYINNIVYAWN